MPELSDMARVLAQLDWIEAANSFVWEPRVVRGVLTTPKQPTDRASITAHYERTTGASIPTLVRAATTSTPC